jgi:hypothetical protein
MRPSHTAQAVVIASVIAALTACGDTGDGAGDSSNPGLFGEATYDSPLFEVVHDALSDTLQVIVHPGLSADKSLHVRVRQGPVGVLECDQMLGQLERIDGAYVAVTGDGDRFEGPTVPQSVFDMQSPYDSSWLEYDEHTGMPLKGALDVAAIEATFYTIDICLMKGDEVVRGAEMDILRALDVAGTGKFDGYGDANERIASASAYAQACVSQMGEIPFFPEISEGDYETYSCLDSTPIPTTVTPANPVSCGSDSDCGASERCTDEICVGYPESWSQTCDNPQYIYSSCEPNAVDGRSNGPRVANRTNEQGTEWVLLCRKAMPNEGGYNDIAMLGHNPYTGVTCFFQNALYSRTDGLHVPHPADTVDSPQSPQQTTSMWSGIQGGLGSGIQCVACHDADPIIHTPWIDGAKDERGDPVLPKMGIRDGFVQGFNEGPYSLVNLEGQGWTMPKHLVSEEAAACTKCHRIGDGRWAQRWLSRMEGQDTRWNDLHTERGLKFEHLYWMPPEMEGIDEATWPETEFGKALDFIQSCAPPSTTFAAGGTLPVEEVAEACEWVDLPTEQQAYVGEPVTTDLQGKDLAMAALKALGSNVLDPNDPLCTGEDGSCETRRCSECHSVGQGGLKHWRKLSATANTTCKLSVPIEGMDRSTALEIVNCMRSHPEDPTSVFAADKMGIKATGVRFGYFRQLFQLAYDEDTWLPEYIRFKSRVGMPKGTYAAFSEMEYAIVQKWFDGGLQHVEELIVSPPAPTECVDYYDTEFLTSHANEMAYEGWAALNKEAGIAMYGCETATETINCFDNEAQWPDKTAEWGNGIGTLRQLTKLAFSSSFWTRSSADGRFVGNGGGVIRGSTITDLKLNRDISVKASFDPGFFPDNSGFIFQGGGTKICNQSVLEPGEQITKDTVGCMKGTGINLYQHLARGLNGGDYFIINSQFTSDAGLNSNKDPVAHFDARSSMKFSPMINDGQNYVQLSATVVDSPFEGDSVLSPSANLVISRQSGGPNGAPLGYIIRKVEKEKFEGNYKITLSDPVAQVCESGAKANFSFDERFFVTHHYENGTSNIYLWDLITQEKYVITNMAAGDKALFPHFRSDGWFYFLVWVGEEEYVVASDFAVELATSGTGGGN